jgi:hypothetical protein
VTAQNGDGHRYVTPEDLRKAAKRPVGKIPWRPDVEWATSIADEFAARKSRGPSVHEPTGIAGLDGLTGGGPTYGTRVYVVGAPDASKTLLLFQIAHEYAKRGIVVGFLAVDEDPEDLHMRLVQRTSLCGRREYEQADEELLDLMSQAVGELPFMYYSGKATIEDAASDLAKRANGQHAALFIDSVQTAECTAIRSARSEMSERGRISANAAAIREVTSEHRFVTFVTSEANREWYKAVADGERKSAMSAGAESRAVEFSARVLIALRRSQGDEDVVEASVPKNKLGRRLEPAFWMRLDREAQTLTDTQRPSDPEPRATPEEQKRLAKEQARLKHLEERSACAVRYMDTTDHDVTVRELRDHLRESGFSLPNELSSAYLKEIKMQCGKV